MARIAGVDLPRRKHVTISLRYLYGGEALYLTEDDIDFQDGEPLTLRFRRSRTDMLMIYVGVTWGR